MWLSALKLGLNAASHIYKKNKKQRWQWQMHNITTQKRMAKGETEYQGKLIRS